MTWPAYRVAAAHVAPVFLDLEKTVDKTCALIEEAASQCDSDTQLIAMGR